MIDQLRLLPAVTWLRAVPYAAVAAVLIAVPADLIDTPQFGRPVAVRPIDYVILASTSALIGLIFAIRPDGGDEPKPDPHGLGRVRLVSSPLVAPSAIRPSSPSSGPRAPCPGGRPCSHSWASPPSAFCFTRSGCGCGPMRSQAARLLADEVAWISADQMREVDRIMIEDVGIELIQMMENAGRNLARSFSISTTPLPRPTVLCGTGGNGGGGLVAARHLANAGVGVTVALTKTPSGVPGHQLDIVQRMGLAIVDSPPSADVAIDALIGYSLRGAPRGRAATLIDAMPHIAPAIVSLDTPSGLDVTSGEVPAPSSAPTQP